MGFFDSIVDAATHPFDTAKNVVEHPLDPITQATGGVFSSGDVGLPTPMQILKGGGGGGGSGGDASSAPITQPGSDANTTYRQTTGGNNSTPGHDLLTGQVDQNFYGSIFNKDVRGG